MSAAQAKLLRALIVADREFRAARASGQLVSNDARWVEVGPFRGYQWSTVNSLEDRGLIETISFDNVTTHAAILETITE